MCICIYIYITHYFLDPSSDHSDVTSVRQRVMSLGIATVGFHNFNLQFFNLRVSNPNKFMVDVFLTRCRISMCQGLGPKKHYEISEIDRTDKRIAIID